MDGALSLSRGELVGAPRNLFWFPGIIPASLISSSTSGLLCFDAMFEKTALGHPS